ncbi:hypothetical protein BCR33DRAFT_714117 [Rhizoclosmatium globosum]|uniref:Uncharacterized protein n=1 Tax=Rhizoclosmatium globosum TaxID=329046 RepID=A0A1Y2CPU1_9FUNG|nr:hypothetical protein BCR33DRAFT_714117 [Rhizoclosmatium globosum]|eukprot:ORY49049.1 hypothetical protein BCR33DRAFT_714117 [Rhizoclosmatium globosum]
MTKLTELEKNMNGKKGGFMPDFDGMLEMDGLDADLQASLPTMDAQNGFKWARSNVLIMGEYTPEEMCLAFEKENIAGPMRKLGLGQLVLQVDTSGDYVQRMTISAEKLITDFKPISPAQEDGFHIIVLGPKGAGGFPVGSDNFLADLFLRRRFLAFEHLKSYQEIMKILPPEETALETMTRHIQLVALKMANSVNEAIDKANEAIASSLDMSIPHVFVDPEPSHHPQMPNSPGVRMHLPATAGTHFQHEFTIDDGKTARILYNFMTKHLPDKLSVTIVEWLALQNPLLKFTPTRPQLPGQHHPGLGVARQVTEMLVHLCQEKNRDALVSSPEYFHNAVMYRLGGWRFLNPAFEGYLMALMEDLKTDIEEKGLAAVSWAFQNCHVVDSEGVVEVWQMHEQFLPISSRMLAYTTSPEYLRLVEKFTRRYRGKLHIDWTNALEIEKYVLPKKEE